MTDRSGEFDELYRATNRRLLQYAYAMTGDLAAAQDITQEAYVRAWRSWREIESYERADSWLRLIVTRLATDRWRRLRTIYRHAATQRVPTVPAPSEDSVVLVAALRRLPVQQRRAICLHYLLDLPVAEIAAEAGVAAATVRSWLSRGRAALATILSPDVFPESSTRHTNGSEKTDAYL
jgi:RNA polymerase sigma-70 factor (ECF subfamily)